MMLALIMNALVLEPVVIAGDVISMVPADSSRVLLVDSFLNLRTIDVRTGESAPWNPSLSPSDFGWMELGHFYGMDRSPDGGSVVMARAVMLPDEYPLPEQMEGMRGVVLITISDPDGSRARPLALSLDVGGGPYLAFTSDSEYLVVSPLFPCEPAPESYASLFCHEEPPSEHPQVNRVNLSTGEPGFLEALDVTDGFWKCPLSDWMLVQSRWGEDNVFSNLATGEVSVIQEPRVSGSTVLGWAEEGALLIRTREGGGLLRTDGTFHPSPTGSWRVNTLLRDGRVIYSADDGASWRLGRVDFETFTPEAGGVQVDFPWPFGPGVPMPGAECSGVLFHDRWEDGAVWFLEIPRETPEPVE